MSTLSTKKSKRNIKAVKRSGGSKSKSKKATSKKARSKKSRSKKSPAKKYILTIF